MLLTRYPGETLVDGADGNSGAGVTEHACERIEARGRLYTERLRKRCSSAALEKQREGG